MLTIEPTHNHVALRAITEKDVRLSEKIITPESANQRPGEYIIVAMGKFRFPTGEPMPLPWNVGDRVCALHQGVEVRNPSDLTTGLLICHINHVLGFIKEEGSPSKFPMLEVKTSKNN